MSKEFIEKKYGSNSLAQAVKQQGQLAYFTQSNLQEDITESYLETFATRKYRTNDDFLNHVKTVFKTDNFLSFFKYYRNPNAASKLIHTRIKEPLSRVFHSEDSYFNYSIRGKEVESPEELNDGFDRELFESILFRHNDIIIHDLNAINSPYRFFLDIDKVVSIQADKKGISKIAYSAFIQDANGEDIKGYAYMDAERFAFFDTDLKEIDSQAHDLGRCPAVFVSNEVLNTDPIVRRSMFTYLRADFEEYVFLKTLQRMTEPNGAIPVVTKLNTKEKRADGVDKKAIGQEPMSARMIGGQQAEQSGMGSAGSVMQAGTEISIPVTKKNDGAMDMDVVTNFIKFFYLPVEALDYLNKRLKEIEQGLIISILGDYSEANESAKNELQISKSYVSKEDKLRWLSGVMTAAQSQSDTIMLGLKHGIGSVKADVFHGSDFFLETQAEIYAMIKESPNAIERKSLLGRLAQSQNRHNKAKGQKVSIMYKLLPYASDDDFKVAVDNDQVDPVTFQLQTRFSYWLAMFEATYGSILVFWEGMESGESEKLVLVNNLISGIIKSNINITQVQNGKEANSTS